MQYSLLCRPRPSLAYRPVSAPSNDRRVTCAAKVSKRGVAACVLVGALGLVTLPTRALGIKQASPTCRPTSCKEMLASADAATYLDVRSPQEFAAGHYKDATNIPFWFKESGAWVKNAGFVASVEEAFKDKDASLVVGCGNGTRGAMAIQAMQGAGYVNLTNIEGGYDAWVRAGL